MGNRFTLHRKNRKAMKAAQNPPCLWEQGQRTAKWLEGSGTHLKVSLRPDCGYYNQPQEGDGGVEARKGLQGT